MLYYIFIDSLVFLGKEKQAFNLFPYSKWHSILFAKSTQIDFENKNKLFLINQQNSLVLLALLSESNLDYNFKNDLLTNLYDVNPWSWFYVTLNYLDNDSFSLEDRKKMIFQMVEFLEIRNSNFSEQIEYGTLNIFIDRIFLLADKFYKNGGYDDSGELYVLTRKIDPWSLDYHQPIFIHDEQNLGFYNFILYFDNIEFKYLGKYGYHYYDYLLKFTNNNYDFSKYDKKDQQKLLDILDRWSLD
jgi:hypothetical protein